MYYLYYLLFWAFPKILVHPEMDAATLLEASIC